MTDSIRFAGLRAEARIGAFDEERATPQTLVMDIELRKDLSKPGYSDDLADTIDYGAVTADIVGFCAATEVKLLERLATLVADRLLEQHDVDGVTVEIGKLHPPIAEEVDTVTVRVVRDR